MNAETGLPDLLEGTIQLDQIEPHIYSDPVVATNEYDTGFGAIYDFIACSRIYNRLIWGYGIEKYRSLCSAALAESSGWLLDAGCGALAFTGEAYAAGLHRPIVFLDQSLNLLRRAKRRLTLHCETLPPNVVFLRGDVLRLPFRRSSFSTVLSLNLLHVLRDPMPALAALKKVLAVGGGLHCTTLVEGGRLANFYLERLGRADLLVPRSLSTVLSHFAQAGFRPTHELWGSLATIHAVQSAE
jgi:SAM-dependent methyltransferase